MVNMGMKKIRAHFKIIVCFICMVMVLPVGFSEAQSSAKPDIKPDIRSYVRPGGIPDLRPDITPGKTAAPEKKDKGAVKEKEEEQFVSMDFNNVDIGLFIEFISELTGKNFVIDNKVKGKITIISPAKVSLNEAYKVFESVLEVHGYATVQSGEIIKIVSSPDVKTKNIETMLKMEAESVDDRVVTQIVALKYADPNEIKRLFSPFVSKSSVIQAYAPTNTLIVTDVYSNIERLLKILKTIDITGVGQEISIIPVGLADAVKLVKLLTTVFKSSKKTAKKGRSERDISFVADERTNTIVVVASKVDIDRVERLIKMLDKEVPKGKEKIHVYYLENATAEDLVTVLQALPKKTTGSTTAKGRKTPVVSEAVKITADKATNSLIIMAEKDDYLVLEEVIKQLDIPRSMVYIECLIMEVNVSKNFFFGTEWKVGEEKEIRGEPGAIGGGFSGSTNYGMTDGISGLNAKSLLGGGLISDFPSGFSVGVMAAPITIQAGDTSLTFPNLGAVFNAYKEDDDVQILSTPQILTTDNEEAVITVGKNVPYQTSATVSGSDLSTQSYEYKDVGVTLKITPQISKGRKIRLKIFQETSRLLGTSTNNQPTTLKKTIDTTVVVDDKNTVVIGGLIDESHQETSYKVPCLGDIPILGYFFSSIGKAGEKTNLYVFLTPTVVESAEEIKEIYRKKEREMNELKEGIIKMYNGEKDEKPQTKQQKRKAKISEWIVP